MDFKNNETVARLKYLIECEEKHLKFVTDGHIEMIDNRRKMIRKAKVLENIIATMIVLLWSFIAFMVAPWWASICFFVLGFGLFKWLLYYLNGSFTAEIKGMELRAESEIDHIVNRIKEKRSQLNHINGHVN